MSGANSVDARRKRAKYQGKQQMGMGTWFFVGGLSRFGWTRRSMRTRQDSSGGGNGARVECSRCTSRRYLGYLDQWSMFPRCESEFQSEPFKDDLSLKLVVFRQVPPPLASFSVSTLRHMVISRRWFP